MLHDLQKSFASVALKNNIVALVSEVRAKRGTRERRLGVYRTNTVKSLTDVLAAAFPVLERIVGERFFRAAALAFIEAHPPQQPALYRYGDGFADFLKRFPPAKDLPYLPDVAHLEWARIESYFAADAKPLNPARLGTIPSEHLGSVVFQVHPSVHLIGSPFPVFEIWAVNQPKHTSVPEIDFNASEHGIVLRRDQNVTQRTLTQAGFAWLKAIADSTALGPATDSATAIDDDFDLQDTLQLLLAEGAFTDANIR